MLNAVNMVGERNVTVLREGNAANEVDVFIFEDFIWVDPGFNFIFYFKFVRVSDNIIVFLFFYSHLLLSWNSFVCLHPPLRLLIPNFWLEEIDHLQWWHMFLLVHT